MMRKGLKRSALVGAIRGYLLLGAIYALEYNGISNDVHSRGGALGLGWREIDSLASSAEGMLFCMQLAILAPLGCILGAMLGVLFDRAAQATTKRPLLILEKIGFPILFLLIFMGISAQLFLVHQEAKPFDAKRWRTVMFIERRTMIDDLTSHHKLKGITVVEAEKLLGPPNDADPWRSKHPDTPCLAYDLGHVTSKYGMCLALYYGKDNTIQDWEVTDYKFW